MNILIIFVEITNYNIARINNVYEQIDNCKFDYIYCNNSISGNVSTAKIPYNARVLKGTNLEKIITLKKLFKEKKYDFIVINGYSDLVRGYAICYSKIHKIPYAIETDTQLRIPSTKLKRILKKTVLTFAFNKGAYGFAGGTPQIELFRYYNMDEDKIKILPMTVDIKKLEYLRSKCNISQIKKDYNLEDKRIVLYSGRFIVEKNIDFLINAIEKVYEQHKDISLLLVGKGKEKQNLINLIKEKKLEDVVKIYDYQPLDKLVEFYAIADLFVLPSSFEQWGLVVNEALACKIPVLVSTNVGSRVDLIKKDINGDIFELNNILKLATLIEKWIYTKKNCDFSINNFWNYDTYKKKLVDILEEVRL